LQKLWLIGILFLFIQVRTSGQEQVLYQVKDFEFDNISIDSALSIIEFKTGLHFTFRSDLLKKSGQVNAHFKDFPLCIVLDSLFANPGLNYQIIESQLVVYEEKQELASPKQNTDSLTNSKDIAFGGKIKDTQSGELLPFAAISILHTTSGTISNEDGVFFLRISPEYKNDTLIISYLGYRSLRIPLSEISYYNIYHLEPTSIPLQEVVIRSLHPENLIRMAIAYKKENYPIQAFVQRAFYRESIKRDKKIMLYSEGILEVLKRPYRPTLFQERVKLIKQRSFKSIEREDTVKIKLHGGIQSSLDLDVVKNSFSFIDGEGMRDYAYTMRDMVMNDDKLTYMIEFHPKDSKVPYTFDGYIYLDVKSLAFVKIEFQYTKASLQKMRNAFIIRQSPRLLILPQEARYTVTYKEAEGKYYIHHIWGELNLKVKLKRKFLSSKYSANFEMVATDIQGNAPRRFSASESMNTNKIFSDLSPNYDLKFWGNENFLLPEDDLMKALKQLTIEL